jgi:hypothetical protein
MSCLRICRITKGLTRIYTDDTDLRTGNSENEDELGGLFALGCLPEAISEMGWMVFFDRFLLVENSD